jgi:hypothetical protein
MGSCQPTAKVMLFMGQDTRPLSAKMHMQFKVSRAASPAKEKRGFAADKQHMKKTETEDGRIRKRILLFERINS